MSMGLPSSSSPGRQMNEVSVGLWERSFQSPKLCPGRPLNSKLSSTQDEPVPLPPPSTAMQELAGHLVSPQNSATQARSRLPKDHSLPGHSPSPAALAVMEGLISSAVRKGHLSPLYVQPLLVKGESCLSSQQNASLKEGKTLSLKRKIFFWQCCKAYEILVP